MEATSISRAQTSKSWLPSIPNFIPHYLEKIGKLFALTVPVLATYKILGTLAVPVIALGMAFPNETHGRLTSIYEGAKKYGFAFLVMTFVTFTYNGTGLLFTASVIYCLGVGSYLSRTARPEPVSG